MMHGCPVAATVLEYFRSAEEAFWPAIHHSCARPRYSYQILHDQSDRYICNAQKALCFVNMKNGKKAGHGTCEPTPTCI